MSTFKKSQVVMLPTNEKANWVLAKFRKELWSNKDYDPGYLHKDKETLYQHLYFLSDEEIKEGDWCLRGLEIFKVATGDWNSDNFKKIIATTDKSLIGYAKTLCPKCNSKMKIHLPDYIECISCGQKGWNLVQGVYNELTYLPQPSQSFLEKYAEAYNSGNPITKVMVEYDKKYSERGKFERDMLDRANSPFPKDPPISWFDYFLKVNPKDNTITIKKVKDSWSRKELPFEEIQNVINYCDSMHIYDKLGNYGDFYYKLVTWLKKNQ